MSRWTPIVPPPAGTRPAAPPNQPGASVRDAEKAAAEEMGRLENFVPESPLWRLEDLVVPDAVRAQLEALLAKVRHHDTLYSEWGLARIDPQGRRVALNLYGPPGTGKTLAAHALASALGRQILRVDYAEIESKYVGDTPKNIKAAFRKASEAHALLLFDEADSVLGRRLTNVTQSADHGVNVSRSTMLLELDRFEGVVVFATNLARNYDGAFVRRILAHVEFPLPDRPTREKLWRRHLPDELPLALDVRVGLLAERSDGLAGGDIKNAVIAAACRAVGRSGEARRVMLDDLLEEIDRLQHAKAHVGAADSGPTVRPDEDSGGPTPPEDPNARTVTTLVQMDEVPDEVRAHLHAEAARSSAVVRSETDPSERPLVDA